MLRCGQNGVRIRSARGSYFNDAQARIDDLDTEGVIGRSMRELYCSGYSRNEK